MSNYNWKPSQSELLQKMEITVTMPRLFGLRVWMGSRLFWLGAWVIGCGVKIDGELPPTAKGAE
jgi:hypothetical protein